MVHDITILFTYFASFTEYEYYIFEVISNLHILRIQIWQKKLQIWRIFFLNELHGVHGVSFTGLLEMA